MTINTNDVIRASAIMRLSNADDIVNVFHVEAQTVGAELQIDLRADIATYIESIYLEFDQEIHTSVSFDTIELFNVTDGNPEPSVGWPTLVAGLKVDDPVPDGVAALSIGRTGVSRVVGKKFWPIATEGDLIGGTWIAGYLTLIDNANAKWIAPFTGASGVTWDPGVFSRVAALFRPFTEAASSAVPAYQRRRKRGVGS